MVYILSTVCIGLGIIIVEFAHKHSRSTQLFNFYQMIFTTMLPLGIVCVKGYPVPVSAGFWLSVSYCAVFATVIAFLLQVKYQPIVGASKTALIFSLESVFAAVFAWFNGEEISRNILIGGGIILFSTMMVDILHIIKPRRLTE